jgi:hypothetical protein
MSGIESEIGLVSNLLPSRDQARYTMSDSIAWLNRAFGSRHRMGTGWREGLDRFVGYRHQA